MRLSRCPNRENRHPVKAQALAALHSHVQALAVAMLVASTTLGTAGAATDSKRENASVPSAPGTSMTPGVGAPLTTPTPLETKSLPASGLNNRLPLAIVEPPQIATGPVPRDAKRDYAYGAFQRGYYLTAVAVATRRAQDDDPAAATLLGVLYERGYGVQQNVKTSASWYEIAARAGDPQAAYRLGLYYLLGTGVDGDKKKAGDLFEQAAKAGLDGAAYNLGVLYMTGDGRPLDRKKGLALFHQAADNGDVEAQYALADAYLDPTAPERDVMQGAFWMGRAARNGNVAAQVRYGILRFKGEGVEPNEQEAAIWFERAAQSGNPVAMNRLARLYATGRGVEPDDLKAATWHLVARKAGISDLWLDGFLASLDKTVLGRAQAEAANWTQGKDMVAAGTAAGPTPDATRDQERVPQDRAPEKP
ncbi:tetratricopeptide repeat protein [Breoghania sp.]|uniref:tetratricopeptide repeat protein n=1 Tax=Breoghania sp. TaxID=2065378 RepID=UPI002AAC3562|nr:tetratricopeptide repeat protein [Breoghania sp.]